MSNKEELREALLTDLVTRIRDGEPTVTKGGEVITLRCPAGVLQAGISFLKMGDEPVGEKAAEVSDAIARYSEKMKFVAVTGGKK